MMRRWGGCEGPQPKLDAEARRGPAERLTVANRARYRECFLVATGASGAYTGDKMGTARNEAEVLGRGVYGAGEALRLLNFRPGVCDVEDKISRQTISRWLRGYDYQVRGETHHSAPLWKPDYANDEDLIELSFRDLIELRFVKAFRDAGVGLPTIRQCFDRAADLVKDDRPFSTRAFRTDGKTIFLEITEGANDAALIDLRQRQMVFRSFVAPSFKDLEFDADVVARWFPLGGTKRTVVIDPDFAFGRPVSSVGRVPTQVLALGAKAEGSIERAAKVYDVPVASVRDAVAFEDKLAA
jgi:uncharacterized protein (DUF433 family)